MHFGLFFWDCIIRSSLCSWLQNGSSPTLVVNGDYAAITKPTLGSCFHGFLSAKCQPLHLTPLTLQNHRTEGKRLVHKQPCCEYLSSDHSSTDIQNRFVFLFLFQFFTKKASKKQVICYSIAVQNACFCRVIECIAPSIHALTARVATALLMWGVSFVFSSPHVEPLHAGHVTHITTLKRQSFKEVETKANSFLIAAIMRQQL